MMVRYIVLFFLLCLTGLSIAQDGDRYSQGQVVLGPYRTTVVDGGELSFIKTGDIEFPISLVMDVIKNDGIRDRVLVDKYDVAGTGPKVESLFFYPVNGVENVLVLISWELSSRGIGTYGTLYQVYAYEKSATNVLLVNKPISFDKNLSGIDGYQEGEEQSFVYKDAASIKKYLKNHYH